MVLELQDLGDLAADTQPSALTGTKPKHLSVFVAACSGQPLQVTLQALFPALAGFGQPATAAG